MNALRKDFWRRYALDALTHEEWEALCDNCGKCCVLKLEDEDTGQVDYTNVGCRLFDSESCRCGQYPLRKQLVPDCVVIRPGNLAEVIPWMPETCAYRVIAEGGTLPPWHHLISGDREAIHEAGMSLRGRTIPEWEVDEEDLEDYIV